MTSTLYERGEITFMKTLEIAIDSIHEIQYLKHFKDLEYLGLIFQLADVRAMLKTAIRISIFSNEYTQIKLENPDVFVIFKKLRRFTEYDLC